MGVDRIWVEKLRAVRTEYEEYASKPSLDHWIIVHHRSGGLQKSNEQCSIVWNCTVSHWIRNSLFYRHSSVESKFKRFRFGFIYFDAISAYIESAYRSHLPTPLSCFPLPFLLFFAPFSFLPPAPLYLLCPFFLRMRWLHGHYFHYLTFIPKFRYLKI